MISALVGAGGTARAATAVLPCDIYASGGTPCVGAYSTVRALYGGYHGALYQVTRLSDGTTKKIGVLQAGGYADAAAQAKFCAGTVCTITLIYDQSPKKNNLGIEGIGGNGAADNPAYANALPVVAGGHVVYGLNVQAGVGYRNDVTKGYPSAATDNAVQANVVAAGYEQVSSGFPVLGTPYVLTNTNSGSVLQPAGCGTADGTPIVISAPVPGRGCQEWTFSSTGNGHYTITNVGSGTVLDSVDCHTGDGAGLDLYSALGNSCQQWDVTPAGPHDTISGVNSGEVLDVQDCETANGTTVRQWAQLDNTCQQWSFTPAS